MKRYILILMALVLLVPAEAQQLPQRKKVALVLGGGGAKGAATVGVLKYVEQSGIPIDFVVGTSIGSIVGGLYSVGYRSEQLDSLFRSQNWLSLLTDNRLTEAPRLFYKENNTTYIMGIPVSSSIFKKKSGDRVTGVGMLRGDSIVSAFSQLIRKSPEFSKLSCADSLNFDSLNFDSLPIPFRCVAVDMSPLNEVVLDHGNLASAMRASMSIPFVFRPMKINNVTLVDGGVLNNLPCDVAKAMGADIIIAIDLSVEKHENEDYFSFGKTADSLLAPLTKLALFNFMKWGIERPDVRKYNDNVKIADLVINPKLDGYGCESFTHKKINEMITLGEFAGREVLKSLEELKRKVYE